MEQIKSRSFSVRRVAVALTVLIAVSVGLGVYFDFLGMPSVRLSANSLMVISPYDYNGTWVFDDSRVGLVREPFVVGVPEMIDVLVADIPNAKEGFRLTFSAKPFPGYQEKLTWVRGDMDGNYYRLDDPPLEGWICPAMFKYYDKPPQELFVKAESKSD